MSLRVRASTISTMRRAWRGLGACGEFVYTILAAALASGLAWASGLAVFGDGAWRGLGGGFFAPPHLDRGFHALGIQNI